MGSVSSRLCWFALLEAPTCNIWRISRPDAGHHPSGATMYSAMIGNRRYAFGDLKTLLAKASPMRSGDQLAGVAAETGEEMVAAQFALADLPLVAFLHEHVVPYE